MDKRIRQYLDWPALELPFQHSVDGYQLCEFIGYCNGCGKPCVELRGEIVQWPNCIQLRCAGRCVACKLVTTFEIRWSKDHMIHHSTAGWVMYPYDKPIINRISNWIKNL